MSWALALSFFAMCCAGLYQLSKDDPDVVLLIDKVVSVVSGFAALALGASLLTFKFVRSYVLSEAGPLLREGVEADQVLAWIRPITAAETVLTYVLFAAFVATFTLSFMAMLAKRRKARAAKT